jgi:hypothetical protein
MNGTRARRASTALLGAAIVAATAARAFASDDGDVAAALVETIEKDAAHKAVVADALTHAKDALERATRLRAVGDEAHARAAEGLAREWGETARDLVRAVDAEMAAAEVRRKAVEAQARLERSRALVEDGILRVGKLRAELDGASKAAAKEHTAVERHDGAAAAPGKKEPAKPGADDAARGGRP